MDRRRRDPLEAPLIDHGRHDRGDGGPDMDMLRPDGDAGRAAGRQARCVEDAERGRDAALRIDLPRNDRALAHERGGEAGRGPGIHPLGRAFILDAAVIYHHHMIGQRHGFFLVVGHVDEGGADALLDRLQFILHLAPQLEIERAQRLVEQQHCGFHHQSAGQGHALPLAAGELMGLLLERMLEADQAQHLLRPGRPLRLRHTLHPEAEGNIAADAHMREQGVVLEHRRCRSFGRRHQGAIRAVDQHAARGRLQETAQDRQQCRLAGAGWAEQHGVAARLDGERHGVRAPSPVRIFATHFRRRRGWSLRALPEGDEFEDDGQHDGHAEDQ